MEKNFSAFFAGLNAAIAIELSKELIENQQIDSVIAVLVSALIAAISQRFMEIVFLELPFQIKYTRRLIDPVSRVEGYWLEEICAADGSCHFSYACIQYSKPGKYKYSGSSFLSPTFELKANFQAEEDQIQIGGDQNEVKMRYYFTAQLYPSPKPPDGLNVRGFGILTFHSDGSPEFNRGHGFFIDDSGVSVNELRLKLDRIPENIVREITGKYHPYTKHHSFTNEEIKRLVKAAVKDLEEKSRL